jgi:hypothetical protein
MRSTKAKTPLTAAIEIYKLYPRQTARNAALRAIEKTLERLKSELFEEGIEVHDRLAWLRNRVETFANSPAGKRGEFTCHASTWFNQARYLDDEKEWFRNGENRRPHQSAQVERFHNNLAEVERAFGAAAMGGHSGANGARQEARHGSGDTFLLESETPKVRRH